MIKSSTVHVGNLPEDVRREEVEEIFGAVGPIKKCFLLKKERYGYVSFALPEDADRAVSELVGHVLSGNQLTVALSDRRQKRKRLPAPPTTPAPHSPPADAGRNAGNVPKQHQRVEKDTTRGGVFSSQRSNAGTISRKRPRLVVRNVPFKVTEEQFTSHFSGVGPLTEARLLRKPDGRLVGCGFVEYNHMRHAATAIKELSGRPLLDRPIIIDWAVDKSSYGARLSESSAAKEDQKEATGTALSLDDEEMECDDSAGGDGSDEDEPSSRRIRHDKSSCSIKKKEKGDDSDTGESGVESEVDDEDDEESESATNVDKRDLAEHTDNRIHGVDHRQAARKKSDAGVASTLFVKNLSFDTDSAALREFFVGFGAVKYAVICVDSLTERPRGTGFVQFARKQDADCLLEKSQSGNCAEELTLDDRVLEVLPALDRQQLKEKQLGIDDEKRRAKDKRNIYLAREGLVRENTTAAAGVSKTDLSKRLGLEIWKVKMLKNVNMFVSQTRLCIHNIPSRWEDRQLRQLFSKHSPAGAKITEARIMRDRRDLSHHPRGTSKEYGFVSFTEHDHALAALRNINNSPDMFTANRRPIVEFSVENRAVVDARQRRQARGVASNPTTSAKSRSRGRDPGATVGHIPGHVGLQSNPSVRALPKPKKGASRHATRGKTVQKKSSQVVDSRKKRQDRLGRKLDIVRDDKASSQKKSKSKAPKNKSRKSRADFKEDASFAALVENYKNKLKTAQSSKSSVRWFE